MAPAFGEGHATAALADLALGIIRSHPDGMVVPLTWHQPRRALEKIGLLETAADRARTLRAQEAPSGYCSFVWDE